MAVLTVTLQLSLHEARFLNGVLTKDRKAIEGAGPASVAMTGKEARDWRQLSDLEDRVAGLLR